MTAFVTPVEKWKLTTVIYKAADDASVASPIASKKQKPVKGAAETKEKPVAKKAAAEKPAKKAKPDTTSTKAKKEQTVEETEVIEDEEEADDQTKDLMARFDSDDDDDEAQISTKSTFKEGQDVGKIPKSKKSGSQVVQQTGTGTVYVGRIPHGFYEHEMRQYFSQFGPITRLRLSRNKKTGASKHFAFVEFADAATAEVVSKTMDGYLLFGHILRCKPVPESQIHEGLWKGANRRFKKVPWNKMAGKQLERPLSESKWEAKIGKEERRRSARAEKLKEMGYEFEAPALKAAEAKPKAIEAAEEAKAIDAPVAESEEKAVEEAAEPAAEEAPVEAEEAPVEAKKAKVASKKKGKKTKA